MNRNMEQKARRLIDQPLTQAVWKGVHPRIMEKKAVKNECS